MLVCGGGRGADILAAECALAHGARVIVCLALPVEEFARSSVAIEGTDWEQRYRDLLVRAEVRELPPADSETNVFAQVNIWMVDIVNELDPQPHVLVVWDGKPGDGQGGTSHLVDLLSYPIDDPHVHVIDPMAATG